MSFYNSRFYKSAKAEENRREGNRERDCEVDALKKRITELEAQVAGFEADDRVPYTGVKTLGVDERIVG